MFCSNQAAQKAPKEEQKKSPEPHKA